MKVKELIEILAKLDADAEVILQKDSEGNGYSPLSSVDGDAVYIPETTWNGTIYSMDWSASNAGLSSEEWEEIKGMPHCVLLAPTN